MIGSKLFFAAAILFCGLQSVLSQGNGFPSKNAKENALLIAETKSLVAQNKKSRAADMAKKLTGGVRGKKPSTRSNDVGLPKSIDIKTTSTGVKNQADVVQGANQTIVGGLRGQTVADAPTAKRQAKNDTMAFDFEEEITIREKVTNNGTSEVVVDLGRASVGKDNTVALGEFEEKIVITRGSGKASSKNSAADASNNEDEIIISLDVPVKGDGGSKASTRGAPKTGGDGGEGSLSPQPSNAPAGKLDFGNKAVSGSDPEVTTKGGSKTGSAGLNAEPASSGGSKASTPGASKTGEDGAAGGIAAKPSSAPSGPSIGDKAVSGNDPEVTTKGGSKTGAADLNAEPATAGEIKASIRGVPKTGEDGEKDSVAAKPSSAPSGLGVVGDAKADVGIDNGVMDDGSAGEDSARSPRSPKAGKQFNFQDEVMTSLKSSKKAAGADLLRRFEGQ